MSQNYKIKFVKGIPPALFSKHAEYVLAEEKANLMYCLRWNTSLQQYVESSEFLDDYAWAGVIRTLGEYGYKREKKIVETGQFSVTGDTIAFWQPGFPDPVRIIFFGDDIEKIERFDILTGRGIEIYKRIPVFDLNALADKTDWDNLNWLLGFPDFSIQALALLPNMEGSPRSYRDIQVYDFTQPQLYFKRFDLLEQDSKRYLENGYQIALYTQHPQELSPELRKYANKRLDSGLPFVNLENLELGFTSESHKVMVLTDRELFGTIFLSQRKQKGIKSSEAKKLLAQLEGEIEVGHYLVHEDYGVGIYQGFTVEDGLDYLKLSYAEDDELFVPLEQIGKLTKYIGEEGQVINLTRLGKGEWNTLRKRVKASVAIAAGELARHYAQTQIAKAPPVETEDSEGYKDFLQKFPFDPTPDQLKSEREIITDLTKTKPMNRLLIGDVGYGKTELILRAAYKVAEVGKQIVVLCPTTVLALQHYNNFTERFKETPFNVCLVSRHNSASQNREILEQVKDHKFDIVIGTHGLLSSSFQPQSLGLLVVDEEQRFGVKQKEKIRKLEHGAHTLYVSATPIPRTLSMALSAIQDISLIQTPPPGRKSVETHIEKLSWGTIVDAIAKETERSGQVFFIHNQISTLASIQAKLQSLLPDLKVAVAHGQLPASRLDKIMTDFYQGKYDCLLSTTIVENGLDVPNVNTMIVTNAERFGLAQMYQLRGRVGRSDRQAYAYFFYQGRDILALEEIGISEQMQMEEDEEEVKKKAKPKYLDRLEAILSAQELGSGFRIASRDLEIRGAGNLLGSEQHGNIRKIGYGLYMQMLAEEVEKLLS